MEKTAWGPPSWEPGVTLKSGGGARGFKRKRRTYAISKAFGWKKDWTRGKRGVSRIRKNGGEDWNWFFVGLGKKKPGITRQREGGGGGEET